MNAVRKNTNLLDALTNLESCLETPIVPGELETWTEEVANATAQAAPLLVQAVEKEHADQLSEISDVDAGLFRKITQLKEQDQESLQKLHTFRQHLASLKEHVSDFEPDESRIDGKIQALIQQGLELVIHARKQEAAIETWLHEAFDRDCGVVD